MHDHLCDLGREIAENELPRRLWCPTGNINDWLHQQSSAIMEARGIRMLPQVDSIERLTWYQRWSHQMLRNRVILKLRNRLSNKRYMNLQLVETQGHLLDRILRVHSPNLLWLSWRHCPYTCLPSWITIKNLKVLKVEGSELETLWQGISQLQELEIINASRLSRIPKSIGQLKHLERILIDSLYIPKDTTEEEFADLNSLKLPKEFGDLNSLKTLVLHGLTLKSLPNSFGKLRNLYHMDLSCCYELERLPDSFGRLSNLHSLNLNWCKKLERLPDSFGSLSNLHNLDLSSCGQLQGLPDSFFSLSNLHSLDMRFCSQLERLPDSFGSLSNLHSLDLGWCEKLERLPDSFGSLSNLHSLALRWFHKWERLPDSFGSFSNLHSLDLSSCGQLKRLPDSFGSLSNLHSLDLSSCGQLERLPDSFGSLWNLHSLDLSDCKILERLPDSFGSLSNLHSLNLKFCMLRVRSELERLSQLERLSNLRY